MLSRLVLTMLLALCAAAWAQAPEPSLNLEQTELTSETPLVLSGEGFGAESTLLVLLTSPEDEVISEQVITDAAGAFRYETRLETPGRWELELRAGEFRRQFEVEVSAPEAAADAAAETSAEAPADEGAPETEEPAAETEAQQNGASAERFGVTPPLARDRAPAAQPEAAPLELDIEGGDVVATQAGRELWRLSFPEESGPTGAVLRAGDELYAGHGNSVLRLEPESGRVLDRWIVSGPVEELDDEGNAVEIEVTLEDGRSQVFSLQGDELQETVRFGLEGEVFGWLAAEAEVTDPAARLEQDPTNPWLYLAAARQLGQDDGGAEELFEQAVAAGQTFYDLAGISRLLLEAGEEDLAERAFDRALADFAARGYHPELLRDRALADAYNFPLEPLVQAVERGELEAAEFWAERLVLASPNVDGAREALTAYAAALEAAGSPDEAAYWRAAERLDPGATVGGGLDRLMTHLGAGGWAAALALLVAALLLYLTLWAKYWPPQSEVQQARRARGAPVRPAARVLAIRYFGVGEKLVLVLMLATALALIALGAWHDRGSGLPLAARSGTLANAAAQSYLAEDLPQNSRAAYIRGYAAQVAGDAQEARRFYAEAGDYPPALNNLGVLNGDESLLRRALAQAPRLPEARHNLGEQTGGFAFQERYGPGEAVLAVPTRQDFQVAHGGTWEEALTGAFTSPWTALRDATPFGMNAVLWAVLLILLLILVVVAVVWLFIPRPGLARNAPRSLLYHLLAVLIPGSGLADEAWGFLLIVPWAVVGLDALSELLGWGFDIGLNLRWDLIVLALIYLVNLIAFAVEFASYQRRMAERRRRIGAAQGT